MITRVLVTHFLLVAGGIVDVAENVTDTVNIDLKRGIVKGYSRHVSFVVPPSKPVVGQCARQTVIGIDLSGKFNTVTITLDYDSPRLWTFHISQSASADGHDSPSSAKVLLFNRQLKVQAERGTAEDDDGSFKEILAADSVGLSRITDDILGKGRTKLVMRWSSGQLQWAPSKGRVDTFDGLHLFGSSGTAGNRFSGSDPIFLAVNRVVAGSWRNGSGLCNVNIVLSRQQEKSGCRLRNGGCVHSCHDHPGNYSCSCLPGFRLAVDGKNCLDVDECAIDSNGNICQHQCVNVIGSFQCICNDGFSLSSDGSTCVAGSHCRDHGCEHGCEVTRASYFCTCRPGYSLATDGKSCTATCHMGNGGCQHRCTATSIGPICTCHHKYILGVDRKSCAPSCSVSNGGCEKRCHNTNTGVRCSCPNGMVLHLDEKTCLDIDECAVQNGGCSYKCQNYYGSYECICPVGYKYLSDEKTCTDINECTINGTCDHICINTPGSFECHCKTGFLKYGFTHCGDMNECSVNNGGCQQICKNMIGSFECRCHDGFYLHPNGKDCLPTGTCLLPPYTSAALVGCQWRDEMEMCHVGCRTVSQLSVHNDSYLFQCGFPVNQYGPKHNRHDPVSCLDSNECPDGAVHTQRFIFTTEKCDLQESFVGTEKRLFDLWKPSIQRTISNCAAAVSVNHVRVECAAYRNLKHQLFAVLPVKDDQLLIAVKIEMLFSTGQLTYEPCDANCQRQINQRSIRRITSILRKAIDKNNFFIRHDGKYFHHNREESSQDLDAVCAPGFFAVGDKCIFCVPGSYYDLEQSRCIACPAGTYQDAGGQSSCNFCPSDLDVPKGIFGAKNFSGCGKPCALGHYSNDGFEPCLICPLGTYQPESGRTFCNSCNGGLNTRRTGSISFRDCIAETCKAGSFFDISSKKCLKCPIGTFQELVGQDHCTACPMNTTTDEIGTISVNGCKSTKCGGYMGQLLGVLESPNYPGDYPSNSQCTWKISPGKGRRILVVVPEVFLADNIKCTDYLVMRKSHSPYSVTTFQACKNQEQPLAFSARSKKLWIRFKSDGKHNAKGFRIPYALYNDEYRPLIEDIVRDSRLYATTSHQQILKDWNLLGALMDVIAHPINYYKYANASRLMFPNSFIRLMTPKVRRFFSYR